MLSLSLREVLASLRARRANFSVVLVVLVFLTMSVSGCPGAQRRDERATAQPVLEEGAYMSGAPVGLGPPEAVNRRDFIYALAFGPDGTLAFTHHVTSNMELTVTGTAPLRPRFQQPVNPVEFDVEDVRVVAAGPARGAVIVPSRQGIVRAFDETNGALLRELILGVPLVRAAVSRDGALLAVGSADGRVLLLDAHSFALRGQARLHSDEVQGLAFLPDGRLVSAAFDKTLVVAAATPGGTPEARMPAARLPSGEKVFLAHLDGARAVSTTWLPRQTSTVITTAAVKRLGLAPASDGALVSVATSQGKSDVPAVELGRVVTQSLDLGPARAGVCDVCVPTGAELALAGEVLGRAVFLDDVARDEVVVKPSTAPDAATLSPQALTLTPQRTLTLPGPATDVDVNAGGVVAVAFSHARAVRSYDLNEAERRGEFPALSPSSGAALVDVERGALGRTFSAHRGFTTTVAVSPDARTIVTGGWDRRVVVHDVASGAQVVARQLGWLVRRVRIAPDGRTLGVAAWTPVNALNSGDSEPSMVLYPLVLDDAQVVR